MTQPVAFSHNQLLIDGEPRVLLCASLFPFRVARAQWRQRLEAVRAIGYHAVDVYIPWNYHETEPGVWDFEGQHDIEAFLQMTAEVGLLTLVRPGPYICSEWDGGAIPAWVATDPALDIRQNDSAFLEAVSRWYDRILPIIARQQYRGVGHGGSVIMMQVDNELDFFACRDPKGYIGALAGMMRAHGVTVPLISCAGQGDMMRAFGGAEGVAPAVNLYPGDGDVDVDAQVRYYREASDAHGVPMVVTETNRWHRTLRRLVGNGARFVGPYLQVSGWDFDYGTGVTNWGRIESYMTHDYDFGGVIDPAGQERPDADDARRLSAVIGALGARLGAAELPADDAARLAGVAVAEAGGAAGTGAGIAEAGGASGTGITGTGTAVRPVDEHRDRLAVGALDLAGGGRLLTLTNVSRGELRVLVAADEAPELPAIALPAGAGAMVVRDLPLEAGTAETADEAGAANMAGTAAKGSRIGRLGKLVKGAGASADAANGLTIAATSGELVALDAASHAVELSAPTMAPGAVWVALRGEGAAAEQVSEGLTVRTAGRLLLVEGVAGEATVVTAGGERWTLRVSQPERKFEASAAPQVEAAGVEMGRQVEAAWTPRAAAVGSTAGSDDVAGAANAVPSGVAGSDVAASKAADATPDAAAPSLESCGVWRGAGRYRAKSNLTGAIGLVLREAADTVNVTYGKLTTTWRGNGGEDLWLPYAEPVAVDAGELTVTARIWGHCNFDDTRLKALRLKASRGIAGALVVRDRIDVGAGWLVDYDQRGFEDASRLREAGLNIGDAPRPRGGLGGRSTTVWPHTLAYTRTLGFGECDAALHIEHCGARCEVQLSGQMIGVITPLAPTLHLGRIHDGDTLTVVVTRMWGEDAARGVSLLLGEEVSGWTVESQGLDELCGAAVRAFAQDSQMAETMLESSDGVAAADGSSTVAAPSQAVKTSASVQALPLSLAPGESCWLRVPASAIEASKHAANTVVRFEGEGLQLTAFTDEHCLGRVVLGGFPGVSFAGGRGDLFLVPEYEGDLVLHVESTLGSDTPIPAHLDRILLGGPLDR